MVIRFENERARNRVFANRKHLKGTGKVISEFLTPKRSALLKECHDHIPGTFSMRSIWTHHGKIFVKKVGDNTIISEIKKIFLHLRHIVVEKNVSTKFDYWNLLRRV